MGSGCQASLVHLRPGARALCMGPTSSAYSFSHGDLLLILGPPWLAPFPWMWNTSSPWPRLIHPQPLGIPSVGLHGSSRLPPWMASFIKMTLGWLLSKGPFFGPREPHTFVPLLVEEQLTPV